MFGGEAWFEVRFVSLITYVCQTGRLARRLIQRSLGGRVRVDDNVATPRQFLEQRINAYNVATTGITDGQDLTIVSRDEQGAIIAGLVGWTWGGCLEIEYLWVHEHRRGQGHGTRLLAAAEDEARKRGCQQALLVTHSFQAPEFYTKMGYTVYAELNDCPKGHRRYYLKKRPAHPSRSCSADGSTSEASWQCTGQGHSCKGDTNSNGGSQADSYQGGCDI